METHIGSYTMGRISGRIRKRVMRLTDAERARTAFLDNLVFNAPVDFVYNGNEVNHGLLIYYLFDFMVHTLCNCNYCD